MSPFEALYGRPYCTPLSWSESGERVIFGPDTVIEAEEKVKQIQVNILAAQSHQKSYANKRRSPLEFEVGDHIYLCVSPMKGVRHFGIKGKLAPRYIGRYPIIDKYGTTSHQVELPARLSKVHNVFHVSQLKRCLKPPADVVIEDTIPHSRPSPFFLFSALSSEPKHTAPLPLRLSTMPTTSLRAPEPPSLPRIHARVSPSIHFR
jgi:hypothetical protein